MADLVRTPERWAACSPEAVASGSEAQMRFFVADAKADIAALLRRLAILEAAASEGERRGLERAAEVASSWRRIEPAAKSAVAAHFGVGEGDMLVAIATADGIAETIRALIPEAPVREGE